MSIMGKNKRHRYLVGTLTVSTLMLIGFQNCSQTKFIQGAAETGKVVGIDGTEDEVVRDPSAKCMEGSEKYQVLSVPQEQLGPDFQALSYEIGKVTCAYTSFLVKVKYLEQFETHLAFRTHRFTGKTELISKTEEGYPQPIYSHWFLTSADDMAAVYVPQKIVDRSPDPIKPELLVRRDLTSGKIQIINRYETNNKLNGKLIELAELVEATHKTFDHHASASSDGNIIIFPSKGGHLIKKNLVTGDTTDLNFSDDELDVRVGPRYLRSYSISGDGSKALYARTVQDNSYIQLASGGKKGTSQTNILADQNNAAHDGYDLKHNQKSIISATGKYAFFEGHYFGGRPFRSSPAYIVRMDLETKEAKVVSVAQPDGGASNYSVPNASLKSVSSDGRYACFIAPRSFAVSKAQTATTFNNVAYVKDLDTGELKTVSVESDLRDVVDCAISASGKTVTYKTAISNIATVEQHNSDEGEKIVRVSVPEALK